MSEQELHELNVWIAEHVMGWRIFKSGRGSTIAMADEGTPREREYILSTTHPWESSGWSPADDPADAMAVLKKCLKKDAYSVGSWIRGVLENESLELEICLLARKLFKTPQPSASCHSVTAP